MTESLGDQRPRSKGVFEAIDEGSLGFRPNEPPQPLNIQAGWIDKGSRRAYRPSGSGGSFMMKRTVEAVKLAAKRRVAEVARTDAVVRVVPPHQPGPASPLGSGFQSSNFVDDSASERGDGKHEDDLYQIVVPRERLGHDRPGSAQPTQPSAKTPAATAQMAGITAAVQAAAAAVNAGRAPGDRLRITLATSRPKTELVSPPAVAHSGAKDLAVIRSCLPNLSELSDDKIRNTDLALLIELNKAKPSWPPQGDFQGTATQLYATSAAHMGTDTSREIEPAVLMANNLDKMQKNPITVPAVPDDPCEQLNPCRFLGGAICSSGDLFVKARELLGVEGATPLSNYDLSAFGISGTLTMRGWKELQNPSSSHNTLNLYSPCNLQAFTGSGRCLTLADGGINVRDHLHELKNDMTELKMAMRVLCTASILAMPWNHSYLALDAGLHLIQYGALELGGFPNRVTELVKFINHIIELNAIAWTQKRPFLTANEISIKFPEWLACSTVSMFKPVDPLQPSGHSLQGGKKNRSGRSSHGASGHQSSQGDQSGQGSSKQYWPAAQPQTGGLFNTTQRPLNLCKRYNVYLNCPNNPSNCVIPGTNTRLAHRCSAIKSNGQVCLGKHTAAKHS